MKTLFYASAAMLALAALHSPASAQDRTGSVQAKVFVTSVMPDGAIEEVNTDIVGLPANLQTEANDNVVPTIAVEYFISNNVSVETICCLTQHDVDGTTGLPGAELVSDAKLIPATVTAKLHADFGGVKPYVGAGPAYFIFFDEKPGAATQPTVTDFDLSNEFGVALQAGIDIPFNEKGLGFSLDAKRYFIGTTATWYAGNTTAIQTEHKLDPWVLSAGFSYRF